MEKTKSDTNDAPSIITHVLTQNDGSLLVRGTTADNGEVKNVLVNDRGGQATAPNFSEWQASVAKAVKLTTSAEDIAGNIESKLHARTLDSF